MDNLILTCDGYKQCHHNLLPNGITNAYSYFEARKLDEDIIFFGLQYLLKKYLVGQVITAEKIDYAENRVNKYIPGHKNLFNRAGWEYIVREHGGKLPILIKAVPDGTIVNSSNVLMTIENTDNKCYWLPNFLETLLSQVWYPCSVATTSWKMKKIIKKYLDITSDNQSSLNNSLVDFGVRGSTSLESSMIGGAAHLLNFNASDNLPAGEFIEEYYGKSNLNTLPAGEHFTVTSYGRDNECEAIEKIIDIYSRNISCPCDSYDIYNACENYLGVQLKNKILRRNGVFLCRADSGDPTRIIPAILNILWDKFGGSINQKSYKVLDPHIRIIQGDGIDIHSLGEILYAVKMAGFSADNLIFGSGGGLLQKVNRDTFSFAFKCSSIRQNEIWQDVYKEPITDIGKNSKKGRLKLVVEGNKYITCRENEYPNHNDCLQTVFENGELVIDQHWDDIVKRAKL